VIANNSHIQLSYFIIDKYQFYGGSCLTAEVSEKVGIFLWGISNLGGN
jgi:hypothetical protein